MRLALAACLLLLAGCAPRLSGVEADGLLEALFQPPTPAEIATVEAEWAARDTAPRDVRVERDRTYGDGCRAATAAAASAAATSAWRRS